LEHFWNSAPFLPKRLTTPPAADSLPSISSLRAALRSVRFSRFRLRQLEAVTLIRQERENGKQQLAYNARPFVLCGIPLRRPPRTQLIHPRRNGRFFLDITGHPEFGLRELGHLNEARLCLSEARTLVAPDTEQGQLIELDLIEAKTAVAAAEYNSAVRCLRSAVVHIDAMLTEAGRLHYRRGVREMYRQRIISMLCSLPEEGNSGNILPLIAFGKANSFSDWLALLGWSDGVGHDRRVAPELRTRLANAIHLLAEGGASVLYGYREKYDDPWLRRGT
jgi:hypothetical protein